MDLSLLTESELELLGKLLAKSAGLFDGDVIPQFRIERVLVDPADQPPSANDMR